MNNQLVLVRQQNLTQLQWTLECVQDIHLSSDGVARTARTVKTAKSL